MLLVQGFQSELLGASAGGLWYLRIWKEANEVRSDTHYPLPTL